MTQLIIHSMNFTKIFVLLSFLFLSFSTTINAQDVEDVYSDTFGFEDSYDTIVEDELTNKIVLPTMNKDLLQNLLKDLSKNNVNKVRAAVALNPNTSENILKKLITDKSVIVRIAAASNPNLPQRDINRILQSRDSVMMVAVASNPNTSINDLASILSLKNPEALLTVYGNPSFPTQYLDNIIKDGTVDNTILKIIATNPALSQLTLSELASMKSGYFLPEIFYNSNAPISSILSKGVDPFENNTSLVQSLLINPNVDANKKIELVDYLSYDVIMGDKASDLNLSIESIRQFSHSSNPMLRKQVASNISAPIDVLRELSRDENEQVRINVAKNPSNSLGVLREMMTDSSQQVRMSLVMNEIIPDSLLYELYDDLVLNLVVNKKIRDVLPDDITMGLIQNPDNDVRYALALTPNISSVVLDILSNDPDELVREAVAVNKRTSTKTLRKLANDTEINVRNGVVLNENTPTETLSEIARNPNNDEYLISDFLFNANSSPELVKTISAGMTSEMRDVIRNRWVNTPQNNYSEVIIRRMRTIFPDILPTSTGITKDASAVLNIVKNPKMPWLSIGTILYSLSDLDFSVPVFNYFTNYFYVRSIDKQIAQAGISKLLLEKMVKNKHYLDKLTIAASPETEYDALLELYESGDDWLQMLVASNPSIGTKFFKYLIDTSKSESVHCGLAQNPLMSVEDLVLFKKRFKSTAAKIGIACKGSIQYPVQ